MRLIYDHSEAVSAFVASLIPFCAERGFEKCVAIGVADRSGLIGGFVFHDWSPEAGVMEISFASKRKNWLSRSILYGMFSYPFNDASCQMVCSRTPASNAAAVRITRAYGFRQVVVPRLFGRTEDGIISTLTLEDWKANGFHEENTHG